MKFPISVAVVLAGLLCGCNRIVAFSVGGSPERLVPAGQVTTKTYSVSDFNGIAANSSFSISYATGRSHSVSIEAEQTALDHIKVSTSERVLNLEMEGSVSLHNPIKVKIVSPSLDSLYLNGSAAGEFKIGSENKLRADLNGSSSAKIEGTLREFKVNLNGSSSLDLANRGACALTANLDGSSALKSSGTSSELAVNLNGDSAIRLSHLSARVATANLDGSSSIRASGSAGMLTLKLGGASQADLGDVKIGMATVAADGGSSVKLGDTKTLTASAGGGSHIKYSGHPQVTKVVSDSGSVGSE